MTPLGIELATIRLAAQCFSKLPSITKPGCYSPAYHSGSPGLFVFVGLLVEKVALEQDSLQVFMATLVRIILFIDLSSGAQELYQKNCSSKKTASQRSDEVIFFAIQIRNFTLFGKDKQAFILEMCKRKIRHLLRQGRFDFGPIHTIRHVSVPSPNVTFQ
jgi:hypothetical protein